MKRFIMPGAVRDDRAGKWKVVHHDQQGRVNIPDRQFMAPLGLDPLSLAISRHELEHIARSPDVPPTLHGGVRKFVEDARVNLSMARSGLPWTEEADFLPEDKAAKLTTFQSWSTSGSQGKILCGLMAIAAIGTPMEKALSEQDPVIGKFIRTFRAEHERLFAKEFRSRNHRSPACSELTAQKLTLRAISMIQELTGQSADAIDTVADNFDPWVPTAPGGGEDKDQGGAQSEAIALQSVGGGARDKMVIHIIKPDLERLMNLNKFGAKKHRRSEDGDVLYHAHRMFVDGKIFRRKNPSGIGGGSVMLDVSGSMSLSSEIIKELTWAAPTRTQVWSYCGGPCFRRPHPMHDQTTAVYKASYERTHHGAITRLSISGKVAAPRWAYRPANGGNECDLEALKFLSKLPHPRVWVSDGGVCGGLLDGTALEQACTRQCAEGRIIWVPRIKEAIQLLQSGKRLNYREFLPFRGQTSHHSVLRDDEDAFGLDTIEYSLREPLPF